MSISKLLNDRAWSVDNNYLFWTWVALLVAMWAVAFNAAWAVGAVRSGLRRVGDLFNPWVTIALVAANLVGAAYMAGVTVQNSSYLAHLWWRAYVVGDPPAEVTVSERNPDGTVRQLSLSGALGIGSTEALRQAARENPGATELLLASPGGFVVEGFGLADAMEAFGIRKTVVLDECASACTLIFLQGEERVMGSDALLGFHRSYSIFSDYGDGWNPVDHMMAEFMRSRGVAEAFIQRAFKTPGWDMYEADQETATANGVATATP